MRRPRSTVNEKKEPFRASRDAQASEATAISPDEERELRALAVELIAAADRMGASFDRAIEAVRNALDPEREAALRRRFEAEYSGIGKAIRAGLR